MRTPTVSLNGKKMTLYEFFEVQENADETVLKSAYRALCLKHHPDKNENKQMAERNFKVVQAVWQILGNKEKRREYDLMLARDRGQLAQQDNGIYINFSWGTSNQGSSTASGFTWW